MNGDDPRREDPGGRDVVVGRIGRAHGLSGHVIVHPDTDNPRRFRAGASIDASGRMLTVVSSTPVDGGIRVRFEGVDDRTAAESLRGTVLRISEGERRRLHADEYWPEELIGLRVVETDGREVGTVTGHVEGIAQDRLVIAGPGGEVEIPFVAELVPEVDLAAGLLRLGPVGGLVTEE